VCSKPPTARPRPPELSVDDHKRLYRRWLEELWNGDLVVADQILAPDFVGSWPRSPSSRSEPRFDAVFATSSRCLLRRER
jgi:hypothetical protein